MMSNTANHPKPQNRATVPTSGVVRWVEPSPTEELEHANFTPSVRNKREYFDNLQKAVAGLTALMNSEMSANDILKQAEMEVEKIKSENHNTVREFLGDDVTAQMERINSDLDDLASLVSGIEASLAGFSPLIELEEEAQVSEKSAA